MLDNDSVTWVDQVGVFYLVESSQFRVAVWVLYIPLGDKPERIPPRDDVDNLVAHDHGMIARWQFRQDFLHALAPES